MKNNSMFKEKGIWGEIIRFIITGGIATVIDFAVNSVVAALLPGADPKTAWDFWRTVIFTASGFIVSLVVNYLLSLFWVYKNVDKNAKTKSFKTVALFVGLSAVGLGIGIGITYAFVNLDDAVLHVNFKDWLKFISDKSYSFNAPQFFWALLFFTVKTLIVLSWNYVSRKKLIFKSPKSVEDESVSK